MIDRLIEVWFPAWAIRREQARRRLARLRAERSGWEIGGGLYFPPAQPGTSAHDLVRRLRRRLGQERGG